MDKAMYEQLLKIGRNCYSDGFAIAVFTPEELDGAPVDKVIDAMIQAGWEVINREKLDV